MKVSKDIYEYIMNFTDNETTLNMLSVNKYFRSLFIKILRKKYPLLISNEKSFYLEEIYYMKLLEKRYNIPYISSPNFDPKKFYINFRYIKYIYDYALMHASESGEIVIIKKMMLKGANKYNWGIEAALEFKHLHIVEFFKELEKNI